MRTRALMSSTVLFACDSGGGSTSGEIGSGGGDGGSGDRSGASLCERGDDNGDVDDGRSVQPSVSKSQPVMHAAERRRGVSADWGQDRKL